MSFDVILCHPIQARTGRQLDMFFQSAIDIHLPTLQFLFSTVVSGMDPIQGVCEGHAKITNLPNISLFQKPCAMSWKFIPGIAGPRWSNTHVGWKATVVKG